MRVPRQIQQFCFTFLFVCLVGGFFFFFWGGGLGEGVGGRFRVLVDGRGIALSDHIPPATAPLGWSRCCTPPQSPWGGQGVARCQSPSLVVEMLHVATVPLGWSRCCTPLSLPQVVKILLLPVFPSAIRCGCHFSRALCS